MNLSIRPTAEEDTKFIKNKDNFVWKMHFQQCISCVFIFTQRRCRVLLAADKRPVELFALHLRVFYCHFFFLFIIFFWLLLWAYLSLSIWAWVLIWNQYQPAKATHMMSDLITPVSWRRSSRSGNHRIQSRDTINLEHVIDEIDLALAPQLVNKSLASVEGRFWPAPLRAFEQIVA